MWAAKLTSATRADPSRLVVKALRPTFLSAAAFLDAALYAEKMAESTGADPRAVHGGFRVSAQGQVRQPAGLGSTVYSGGYGSQSNVLAALARSAPDQQHVWVQHLPVRQLVLHAAHAFVGCLTLTDSHLPAGAQGGCW